MLSALDLAVVPAASMGVPDVEETGSTLAENALLKAAAAFEATGLMCIADDSGLFVDALDGAPGIYSARFAGENVSYADNNRELLRRLEGVADIERGAAFVSVIALLVPDDQVGLSEGLPVSQALGRLDPPDGARLWLVEGRLSGTITRQTVGSEGFGYDPVFFVPSEGATLAELAPARKNILSHRGAALAALEGVIGQIVNRDLPPSHREP
jgi:XTP/dITP diphosphohydrolase